ncbi:hypothetical protein DFJ58DRAFT_723350 [Suillus subalutaceus]|uniref:uncharacterized protein n=1 Tax=Suillus subalutaceus TaxID=48586 RepID=UPI001B883990|nr:uncharacterized protein DFJ58DRAFT_723350 [Suillus subalutaceus]KAG1868940.1 hypothetical protein DFJ58DRAFT_723350 [Suillus subalutaceus]
MCTLIQCDPTKKSALKAIEKVKMVMVYTRSKKPKIPSSLNHSESSISNDTPMSNLVLETPRSEEVQKLLEIILNAKNLVVICGPGVSVPVAIRSSCQSLSDPFNLLHPIIWQDQAQSSLVFQTLKNIDAMEKTAGVLFFGLPTSSQIAQDKNLVDVVLAVGVHPIPHSNYSTIIKQFAQAAQSRAQIGVPSTILMDQDMPTLEKAGIQDLFQVSLDAVHNPASNTMVISRKPELMDFSMKQDDEEGGGGGGGGWCHIPYSRPSSDDVPTPSGRLPDAHPDLHTLIHDSILLSMPSVLQSTIGLDPYTFVHPYINTFGPPQLSLLHPPLVLSDPSSFHLGLYLP